MPGFDNGKKYDTSYSELKIRNDTGFVFSIQNRIIMSWALNQNKR